MRGHFPHRLGQPPRCRFVVAVRSMDARHEISVIYAKKFSLPYDLK